MIQQNNENSEICKLSKESHKYLVNKGKNADSSNIPLCAIIAAGLWLKHKEKRFTLFFCIRIWLCEFGGGGGGGGVYEDDGTFIMLLLIRSM